MNKCLLFFYMLFSATMFCSDVDNIISLRRDIDSLPLNTKSKEGIKRVLLLGGLDTYEELPKELQRSLSLVEKSHYNSVCTKIELLRKIFDVAYEEKETIDPNHEIIIKFLLMHYPNKKALTTCIVAALAGFKRTLDLDNPQIDLRSIVSTKTKKEFFEGKCAQYGRFFNRDLKLYCLKSLTVKRDIDHLPLDTKSKEGIKRVLLLGGLDTYEELPKELQRSLSLVEKSHYCSVRAKIELLRKIFDVAYEEKETIDPNHEIIIKFLFSHYPDKTPLGICIVAALGGFDRTLDLDNPEIDLRSIVDDTTKEEIFQGKYGHLFPEYVKLYSLKCRRIEDAIKS